ncbi:MAG: LysM peptidoglycan-binding domain-containing protein [Sphingomonas sp.]
MLKNTTHDSNTGSGSDALWETWYEHDALGNLVTASIVDGRPRTVTLVNDAEGRVLQRDEWDALPGGDPRELHYYFNGVRVGDISNDGTSNTDYAASIAAAAAVPGTGAFRGGAASGAPHADFDQSYDAINGFSHESAASAYVVQAGDTLAGIALQLWGDAGFWYLIAEANGLSAATALTPGPGPRHPRKGPQQPQRRRQLPALRPRRGDGRHLPQQRKARQEEQMRRLRDRSSSPWSRSR